MGNTCSLGVNGKKEIMWNSRTGYFPNQHVTRNTNAAFLSDMPQDYPKFIPTLYFVDLTKKDIHFSNSLSNSGNKNSKSVLYLKTAKDGYFHLTFSVKNPEFSFVKISERPSLNRRNSKASQAYSVPNFRKKKLGDLIITFHEKEYKSRTIEPTYNYFASKAKTKFHSQNQRFDGTIYITQDDIQFVLPIKGGIKISNQFNTYDKEDYESSGIETNPISFSENRASLLLNIGQHDYCRVNFEMNALKFTKVCLKASRGCQVDDPYTYIKTKTHSLRSVYVPIPVSTYMYEDPRKQLSKITDYQMRSGTKPAWMDEVRKERKRQFRENIKKSNKGCRPSPSSFIIQKEGFILKMQTGIIQAQIRHGEHLYEDFVRAYSQRFGDGDTTADIENIPDI